MYPGVGTAGNLRPEVSVADQAPVAADPSRLARMRSLLVKKIGNAMLIAMNTLASTCSQIPRIDKRRASRNIQTIAANPRNRISTVIERLSLLSSTALRPRNTVCRARRFSIGQNRA